MKNKYYNFYTRECGALYEIIREEFDRNGNKVGEFVNGPATTKVFADEGARSMNMTSFELGEHIIYGAREEDWKEQVSA